MGQPPSMRRAQGLICLIAAGLISAFVPRSAWLITALFWPLVVCGVWLVFEPYLRAKLSAGRR